jgi:DNA-directed RNA polymerase specialized sigma24 family protein
VVADSDLELAPLKLRVDALAQAVAGILDLDPVHAARSAPRLIDEAKAVMAAVRRSAIAEAVGEMTHAELAALLGVSPSAVNNTLVEHRARTAAQTGEATPTRATISATPAAHTSAAQTSEAARV